MKVKFIGVLFVSVAFLSSASNVTIYRWVDSNNVVHFSQQQPEHDDYTELSMSAPKRNTTSEKTEPVAKTETALAVEGSKDKCEEAKANVQTLKTYDKIQYKDTDGKVKVLDATQKQQQIEINEKQVEVYCRG
jgi:phosphate starvation-inducible protein PhoH